MCCRASEVVEIIGHRLIIYCVQQSRWKVCSARLISAKDFKCKFIWSGVDLGFGNFGVLHNENWIDKEISIGRVNHWILSIHILCIKLIINIFSFHASQTALSVDEKDLFYDALLSNISTASLDDFNGLVGKAPGILMEFMVNVDLVHLMLMD